MTNVRLQVCEECLGTNLDNLRNTTAHGIWVAERLCSPQDIK